MRRDQVRLAEGGGTGSGAFFSALDSLRNVTANTQAHKLFAGVPGRSRLKLLFAIAQRDYRCEGFSLELQDKVVGFGDRCLDTLYVSHQNGIIQTSGDQLEAWPLFSARQMIATVHRERREVTHADVWIALDWIKAADILRDLYVDGEQHANNPAHPVTRALQRAYRANARLSCMKGWSAEALKSVVLLARTCQRSPVRAVPHEDASGHSSWAVRLTNPAWKVSRDRLGSDLLSRSLEEAIDVQWQIPSAKQVLRDVPGLPGAIARCVKTSTTERRRHD